MAQNPVFSQEQYEYLKRVFPKGVITPESTMNEIQYNAGTQSVLDTVHRNTQGYNRRRVGGDT